MKKNIFFSMGFQQSQYQIKNSLKNPLRVSGLLYRGMMDLEQCFSTGAVGLKDL
jgi:hypothetical protein